MGEQLKYHEFSFEKLNVWQNSICFVEKVYKITEKFPKVELYCLTSQIRRAVISIPSNIAEGSTRKSFKDQARYTEIAFGSLLETLNQLVIANKLGYIDQSTLEDTRFEIEKISRQLNALKNSQLERQDQK
ncbi:MAG: four helix bundle protein [Candidatus Gastranaerophilales bacterium]|nr:four helix bundle protein [Candidatus Gastranaerophilales bacterium]